MARLEALILEAIETGDLVQIWTTEGYQKIYPIAFSEDWLEYMVHYKDGDVSSGLIRLSSVVRAERPYRPRPTPELLERMITCRRPADDASQGKVS